LSWRRKERRKKKLPEENFFPSPPTYFTGNDTQFSLHGERTTSSPLPPHHFVVVIYKENPILLTDNVTKALLACAFN
jgi:hypothetical protein